MERTTVVSDVPPIHVLGPGPNGPPLLLTMSTDRLPLGRRVGRGSPAWLARVGAPVLGSSASLALTGRRVVPTRLSERGFTFEQPDFEPAARQALVNCGLL